MKYPRRVQVQGQRVLVKNLGLLITRKTKRIDNRLAGPSKMRADSWQKKLLDDDELFLLL